MRKNAVKIFLTFAALAAFCGCLESRQNKWKVVYPYKFDIPTGSYAWIVTSDRAEKTSSLHFNWDAENQVLFVNEGQIYPALPEKARKWSELELEKIYGDYPFVRRQFEELGTWNMALEIYRSLIKDFQNDLNTQCRRYLAGDLTEADLREYFADSGAREPYAEILELEKGLKFFDEGFEIYAKSPYGPTPYQMLFSGNPEKPLLKPPSKKGADGIVRRIVGFFQSQPDEPHVVIIGNGGVNLVAQGQETVSGIEQTIERAIEERSVPNEPQAVSTKILRHIVENVNNNPEQEDGGPH